MKEKQICEINLYQIAKEEFRVDWKWMKKNKNMAEFAVYSIRFHLCDLLV